MRDCLLYVNAKEGRCEADVFGAARTFDVAINDWTGRGPRRGEAEYWFTDDLWKFLGAYGQLAAIRRDYRAIGLLDDDVVLSTAEINRCFSALDEYCCDLLQPAQGYAGECLYQQLRPSPAAGSTIRPVGFVELLAPFFGPYGLDQCWDTFGLNESGHGLDHLWGQILDHDGIAVLDEVHLVHTRPLGSGNRQTPGGKWPRDEGRAITREHGVRFHPHTQATRIVPRRTVERTYDGDPADKWEPFRAACPAGSVLDLADDRIRIERPIQLANLLRVGPAAVRIGVAGVEKMLLDVPLDLLAKPALYGVECHGYELGYAVEQRLERAGYRIDHRLASAETPRRQVICASRHEKASPPVAATGGAERRNAAPTEAMGQRQ
jgi:hypothetical protein